MVSELRKFPDLFKPLARAEQVEVAQLANLQDLFGRAVNDVCGEYLVDGLDVNCVHLILDRVESQMLDVKENLSRLSGKAPQLSDCIARFIASVKESMKVANDLIVEKKANQPGEELKLKSAEPIQELETITKEMAVCDEEINAEYGKLLELIAKKTQLIEKMQHHTMQVSQACRKMTTGTNDYHQVDESKLISFFDVQVANSQVLHDALSGSNSTSLASHQLIEAISAVDQRFVELLGKKHEILERYNAKLTECQTQRQDDSRS